MKKKLSKLIAIAAAMCLLLCCLTACGDDSSAPSGSNIPAASEAPAEMTAADIVALARTAEKNVKSLSYDMVMDMSMSGDGEEIAISTSGKYDYIIDPMSCKMDMTMDMGDMGGITYTLYMTSEDGQFVTYTGMDIGTGELMWVKQTVEADFIDQYDALAATDTYLNLAENFEIVGEEDVNGMAATHITGIFTGDALSQVIESSGALDSVGVDTETVNALSGELGDMCIDMWIDLETGLCLKYEMDMCDLMQKLFENIDAEAEGISVDSLLVSMTVTSVDSIESIDIPEEALNAQEFTL